MLSCIQRKQNNDWLSLSSEFRAPSSDYGRFTDLKKPIASIHSEWISPTASHSRIFASFPQHFKLFSYLYFDAHTSRCTCAANTFIKQMMQILCIREWITFLFLLFACICFHFFIILIRSLECHKKNFIVVLDD